MLGSQAQSWPQAPSWLPNSLPEGKSGRGLFNREMGPLQRQLQHGEFKLLRHARMLESDFAQVNRRGEAVDIHNEAVMVTAALACTSHRPDHCPDVLIVARSVVPSRENLPPFENLLCQYPPPRTFELTRLLPLSSLRISIHNEKKQQLRFKLPTGRAFYLELCCHPDEQEELFALWVKVVDFLYPPSEQPWEIPDSTQDLGGPEEARIPPQSPSPIDLDDTVSIHTVYTFRRGPSPGEDHARSRWSPSLSVRSHCSTEDPTCSPFIIEATTLELGNCSLADDVGSEESLQRPPSCKDLSPEEQVKPESDPPSNRTTTKGRSKSPRRASQRKPSKILSLIRSCSWGSQKRNRRHSKGRAKGKKL